MEMAPMGAEAPPTQIKTIEVSRNVGLETSKAMPAELPVIELPVERAADVAAEPPASAAKKQEKSAGIQAATDLVAPPPAPEAQLAPAPESFGKKVGAG